MALYLRQSSPEDVVEKVLRRAELANMARKLKDRLALASHKIQHGQENLSFRDVEALFESSVKRKRLMSAIETSSTCSSSSSENTYVPNGVASSPLTAPLFSDAVEGSGRATNPRKRSAHQGSTYNFLDMTKTKRPRSHSMAPPLIENTRASWKTSHNLPQSSPVHSRHASQFSTIHGPDISFASEISTIPDSPTYADEERLTRLSYHGSQPNQKASPPQTPPPTTHRRSKYTAPGEEGADLLLFLATSPSAGDLGTRHTRLLPPSTPPSKELLRTPALIGRNTPGQNFNFAEFINITPSPAQGAFGDRTPGISRTPLAAKDARRKLNFDSLVPPNGSPPLSNVGRGSIKTGLGMDLGEELVS
ncbi:uncharacterized protein KY384_005875 [Bacidia gigantensis]|uniref:uncharacterized protein n=1 Tax=Bacidia gigantensis TaxID=2732470 RepID=UPI001D03BAD0|nr:uncharacterized protein KY384_005875 [Bacidia gigantensis]KAG8529240.1 hypothetical protein KY384_005875 [Bacidia gigantensis]